MSGFYMHMSIHTDEHMCTQKHTRRVITLIDTLLQEKGNVSEQASYYMRLVSIVSPSVRYLS